VAERWKQLPYKSTRGDLYFISNQGRLKKKSRVHKDGLILKGANVRGYQVFNTRLTNDKGTSLYIHKLVAQEFLKRPSKKHQFVIHKDYEKLNNKTSNLKWVTRDELNKHHKKNPNILNLERPSRRPNAKLTESKVKQIKKMLAAKKPKKMKDIAAKFDITQTQLNRIKNGKNWANVTI